MKDEIFFNQSKYIKEMLKKFVLEDSKPTKTPMSTEINLTKDEEADSMDITKYQDKGKRVDPPSSSSSSSSSDENKEPSFLEFHKKLSDNENLTNEQKEKRGISSKTSSLNFKRKTVRMNVKTHTYVNLESSSEEHQNEKTSPPPRKKSLSPPHTPSKSTSSKSTHYTSSSSSSPSESPTPTHIAPPPKLQFVILIKLEPQELPP
ncbi:hypothetical protein Tco_0524980 [Tanacetum coccineum]